LSDRRCRVAVLISGSGSNLQSFIDCIENGELDLEIAVVISNRADAFGLERAARAQIPSACIPHNEYNDREAFDRAVAQECDEVGVDLLILAGFMRILSPWFVEHFADRIINIHPALLPAYPGLDTHQRVLDAGDKWHGSTVHLVTAELDAGPRILQGRLATRRDETAAELASRVQAVEHQIYPRAAGMFASGDLSFHDGGVYLGGERLLQPITEDFE